MPRTLSSGATGSDVIELQSRLNNAPLGSVPLDVDGIFGPKTRARVVEFQARKGLAADGIVGPKTWAALLEGTGGLDLPRRTGIDCGTGDPANKGLVSLIANLFGQGLAALGIIPAGAGFNLSGSGSLASLSLPAPPTFRKLTPGEVITATGVFGSSIDFSTVYISDKSGAQNRAFTAAIPVPAALAAAFGIGSGMVQVMNLGSRFAAPGRDLLIHELTHVWQSQHATSKVKFMANSLACQGAAIAANLAALADGPRRLRPRQGQGHPLQRGLPRLLSFLGLCPHPGQTVQRLRRRADRQPGRAWRRPHRRPCGRRGDRGDRPRQRQVAHQRHQLRGRAPLDRDALTPGLLLEASPASAQHQGIALGDAASGFLLLLLVCAFPAGKARDHWAFRPLPPPAVPATAAWAPNPIDAFLPAKGSPAPAAPPHTLLRRLHRGLAGLPPTPAMAARAGPARRRPRRRLPSSTGRSPPGWRRLSPSASAIQGVPVRAAHRLAVARSGPP